MINEALRTSSYPMSSSKRVQTNDGNTITLSEDSDIDVGIWIERYGSLHPLGVDIPLFLNPLDIFAESILILLSL